MIDLMPAGYLTVQEAHERLQERIAGHEKFTPEMRDWIEKDHPKWSTRDRLLWARDGLAREMLEGALIDGKISAFVRDGKTGETLRLPPEIWLDPTSRNGLAQGHFEHGRNSHLFRYFLATLMIEEAGFGAWLSTLAATSSGPTVATAAPRPVSDRELHDFLRQRADRYAPGSPELTQGVMVTAAQNAFPERGVSRRRVLKWYHQTMPENKKFKRGQKARLSRPLGDLG